MGTGLDCLQNLDAADQGAEGAVGPSGPLFARVHQPEVDGIDPEFLAQFVQQCLHREGAYGRSGGAVGCGLGLVVDDVIAVDQDVGDVVGGEHAGGGAADGRAGISAGFKGQIGLGGNDFPFLGCADLRSHVAATGGSGGFHDLDPAKTDRNGTAAFLGKSYCDRLDVGGVLSAEAAADLQGYQLDLGG